MKVQVNGCQSAPRMKLGKKKANGVISMLAVFRMVVTKMPSRYAAARKAATRTGYFPIQAIGWYSEVVTQNMRQLTLRPRRAQAAGRENLLGQRPEAAKMTIHFPPFANDLEAAHPWITWRPPFLRRRESAIRSPQTARCSIGSRKWRGSPNRKTFSGVTARRKRTRGSWSRRNGWESSSN